MKIQHLLEMSSGVIDANNMDDVPSLYTRYFSNPQYFIREKNIKIDIVDMNVDEYLSQAKQLLTKSWGSATLDRAQTGGSDKIARYAELMKNGTKFPLPYLDYIDKNQQGMHRVEAAKSIGIKTVPVMVIRNAR